MKLDIRRAEFHEIEPLRALYRHDAHCQIVHDSALGRGLSDGYLIQADGRVAGYGGVWNKYHPGQLHEFHVLPAYRADTRRMFEALLASSKATHLEAQSNMPSMFELFGEYACNSAEESTLFTDARLTRIECRDGTFHARTEADVRAIFEHQHEPVGDWVIESAGAIVATGGFLRHYNPPYADIFMEVFEPARRRGFGSFLVQELKRACYECGKVPAARCNPTNTASRKTLERAGFVVVGSLVVGDVRPPQPI